ncbi:MAG: NAD(P)H-hydrate epimerase, partial [Verrucomicrobiota bacterium]
MLVTCREMSRAEEALFSTGVSAEPYMDEAGRQCAEAIRQFRPTPGRAEIFCGKGNNGGDALVVARWLKRWGWSVEVHWCGGEKSLSPLGEKKRAEFEAEPMLDLPASRRSNRLIVVDGLLGIGASGDLRGEINAFAERINHLREAAFATCFAIDIPTGLNADTGEPYRGAVKADVTLSITAPKLGFAADRSVNFVGRLVE